MESAAVTGLILLAPTMTVQSQRARRPRFADTEEIRVVEEIQLEQPSRSLPSSPRRLAPRRVRLDRVAPASPIARSELRRFYDCISLPPGTTAAGSEFEKSIGKEH